MDGQLSNFFKSTSGSPTVYLPSNDDGATHSGGGAVLRAVYANQGVGGSVNTKRYIEFKDASDDTVLFSMFVQRGGIDSHFTFNSVIPGDGIRFPNGIKVVFNSHYAKDMSILYE